MANVNPENSIANGTISVNVPNLTAFNDAEGKVKPVTSTIHKIGGLAWRMQVRKVVKNNNELDLYIFCNEDVKDRLWLCKVQFTVQNLNVSSYTESFCRYGFNSYYWILTILAISNTTVIQWPIQVNLVVKVFYAPQESFLPLDTSLVVNMGEDRSETMLVNKYLLTNISSYFRNLFVEDWRDKREQDGTTFELNEPEDFDIRAFKAMLYGAMAMGWMVQESNMLDYELAVEIIKLAIKYHVPMLLDYCEKFLITSDNSKMDSLELADQFNLITLKEHCLNQMSALDFMEDFSKDTGVHSRLSKATREQLQQRMGGKAKELRESTMSLHSTLEWSNQMKCQSSNLTNPYNKLANVVLGENVKEVKY